MSILSGTSNSDGYASSPSASWIWGFTGMTLYPCSCMYADTPWLARRGLADSPMTAMVLAVVRRSRMGSGSCTFPLAYCHKPLLSLQLSTSSSVLTLKRQSAAGVDVQRWRGETMRNRLIATFLTLFSVVAIATSKIHVPAQKEALAGLSGLALTIYNQNFAVIRQPIDLNLKAGSNRIEYADTTAHLEPDSVILQDPSGTHSLRILEQNYRNDPVTEARLLAAYEGQELEFEVNRDG